MEVAGIIDVVGFLAEFISVVQFFEGPEETINAAYGLLQDTHEDIESLKERINRQSDTIKSMITTGVIIEVRSRLKATHIPSANLELLIKLLLAIKDFASNVVFALVVKYPGFRVNATLGVAGMSSDRIEDLVENFDGMYVSLQEVREVKTCFVNVRIRGKYERRVENFCSAALSAIATEVFGFPAQVSPQNEMEFPIAPAGNQTFVLLRPEVSDDSVEVEFDQNRRKFIVGNTRSGKSTVGNALLEKGLFEVLKGMTGTMQLKAGHRTDVVNHESWRTDLYDIPGLNDKDGLDVWYEAAIEDHIKILQQISSLVMTVNVDGGISRATFVSLDMYKKLFGEDMASMLILVLTVNEPASEYELEATKNNNWPTIRRLDHRIRKEHVFCVSLHDLRQQHDCPSRTIVELIRTMCRAMPMSLITSLATRYKEIRDALKQREGNVEAEVQTLVDDGWQAYDNLTESFERQEYVKLTDDESGLFDGFVMKCTSEDDQLLAFITLGLVNNIRKTAIHVQHEGIMADTIWSDFLSENRWNRKNCTLMRRFGDHVSANGMAVLVRDAGVSYKGTLHVQSYFVSMFNPVSYSHEQLASYLTEILKGNEDEMAPEVVDSLRKMAIPRRIVAKLRGRREATKKSKK
ncbi:unnamed protein product [Agarophyton chilense]